MAPVIYQHPLAYLLGLEGIALLRAFSGAYDRDFALARLREIQALLDSAEELGDGVEARPITAREGYDRWAAFYDEPGNQLLEIEQPVVREILDRLPVGVALDAACGTGRHTVYLASLGHLRPNGHLVISDSRGLIGDIGLPLVRVGPGGEFGYMPTYARLASDYLAAALPLGLQVRRCEEPRTPSPLLGDDGATLHDGVPLPDPVLGDPPYIWSLHALAIDATNAAWRGRPAAIIWHFQLAAD